MYSPRFSYKGMTGTFPALVVNGMKNVQGTAGPSTEDATTKDGANANPDASLFDVEYTMQTGPTRYAPMQPVPGTKVTKKTASMQYPTSSVPIATAHLPIPKIQTTITQSQTHKVTSIENTVCCSPRGCLPSGPNDWPILTLPRLPLLLIHRMTWRNFWRGGKIRFAYLVIASLG